MGFIERQVETFAPTATIVAVHSHQIEDGEKRMDALERELRATRAEARAAAADLLETITAVKVEVKGISTRLAVYVGLAAVFGSAVVTAVIQFLIH